MREPRKQAIARSEMKDIKPSTKSTKKHKKKETKKQQRRSSSSAELLGLLPRYFAFVVLFTQFL
jgi:hypothetical protein